MEFVEFSEAIESEEVKRVAKLLFELDSVEDDRDWMYKFMALVALATPVLPEFDIPGIGSINTPGLVFYSPNAFDKAYDPWSLVQGLGASSWYDFRNLNLPSIHFICGDHEQFPEDVMDILRDSVWVLIRSEDDIIAERVAVAA